jgi:PRTRC genetic system protein A
MTKRIILPYFSCVVDTKTDLDEAISENFAEIYIISGNGCFRRTNLTHGRSVTVPCPTPPKEVELMDCKQDTNSFFPAGKIPIKFLHQIEQFFKQVMIEHKGAKLEAMAFVIWNPTQGYHVRIPEQTVSAGAVNYNWAGFLTSEDVIVLDIHSHNDMGAFFSGTDDSDDRGNCYVSGVIGKLSTTCDKVFRFNLPGNMKINPLPPELIFETYETTEVPAEWLAQVKKQQYVAPTYNTRPLYSQNTSGVGTTGGGANRSTTTTPGGRVVANESFRGNNGSMALESVGLSADDTEVLNQFGFPFPCSGTEEDSFLPFPQRPQVSGRQSRKGKRMVPGSTRLQRKLKDLDGSEK